MIKQTTYRKGETTMDEKMMERALLNALNRQDESDDSDIYVSSIHDANILLQQHMNPGGAWYRKR